MYKILKYFLLVLILLPVFVFAQTRDIDSLKQIVKYSKVDTLQIKAAIEIGDKTRNAETDTAIVYYTQALNQCNQLLQTQVNKASLRRIKFFKANALNSLGLINKKKSDYNEAIKLYQQSLELREEISDKYGIATSLNNLASIYRIQGQSKLSLDYNNRALKIREELDDKKGISNSLNNIANFYSDKGQSPEAFDFYLRSLKISQEIGDKSGIANTFSNLGGIYSYQGQITKALNYHKQALKIYEEINDKYGVAKVCNGLAVIYKKQGQITQALEYYTLALKISEVIGDKVGIADLLNNISILHKNLRQTPQALDYSLRALKIREEIGDKFGITSSLNFLANHYSDQGQIPLALEYHTRSLKISEDLDVKSNIAMTLNNIANIFVKQGKFIHALEYYTRSIKISDEIPNKELKGAVLNSLAKLKLIQKDDSLALKYGLSSFELAKELGFIERIKDASFTLHEVYLNQKNYTAALEMYKLYIVMHDSIQNEENQKKSLQNKMQYEYEKTTALQKVAFEKTQDSIKLLTERKLALQALDYEYEQKQAYAKSEEERKQLLFEEEIKRNKIENNFKQKQSILKAGQERKEVLAKADQEKKDLLTQKEKEKQRLILFSVIASLLLVGVFAVFMHNRYKTTQKQKEIIELKEKETQEQKHLVEEKQKEILDSIHYAKRLQEAILPPLHFINEHVPNNFVLYQPKDVVAGDFYWAEIKDDKFFIAAADSTGHGVPGAMVSVVCSNALNRTVNEFGITDAGKILDKTRELVLETFAKGNSEVKDGMDISLLCVDKANHKAFWSGANNPLWYVKSSVTSSAVEKSTDAGLDSARPDIQLIEIKADKQPIGKSEITKPFTVHEIALQDGMQFYLFTDGFADQFGGPRGKKFMYKQLENLLISISHESMEIQKKKLEDVFENWKGDLEQVDDVCMIGVRI